MRDRGFVRELIQRAIAAKCSALFPTLDLPILGQRYCDVKNGMTVPPQITFANVVDVATKPTWAMGILKGKLDVEDARIAAGLGVSAIVVSNHGGRQLDGAPSSVAALPKIAQAVGSDVEIIFDGGIRSGQDVLR